VVGVPGVVRERVPHDAGVTAGAARGVICLVGWGARWTLVLARGCSGRVRVCRSTRNRVDLFQATHIPARHLKFGVGPAARGKLSGALWSDPAAHRTQVCLHKGVRCMLRCCPCP